MRRIGFIAITLCAFFILMGLGITISVKQFNQMVLPEQPLKIYEVVEKEPEILQIELLGETCSVNVANIKQQVATGKEQVEKKWQKFRNDPQLHKQVESATILVKRQWQALIRTEEVRAVNQWVKDQL
ncbi:hypothetical protein [Desulforamulus aeronauticus]|uniref:Uncharacterized protein n=1 Tax=Desulforamulus aeronauticus DSM 10349 TaxID=1121421 RepID=A0A1M6VCZ0_9FIRM|nr:hypothetical protein [Desulforamulus aeronauticus]SHK79215.1 hypothetical protein SAMN02745123_03134 [Desulforamulus aeronauticus DSM 10349]